MKYILSLSLLLFIGGCQSRPDAWMVTRHYDQRQEYFSDSKPDDVTLLVTFKSPKGEISVLDPIICSNWELMTSSGGNITLTYWSAQKVWFQRNHPTSYRPLPTKHKIAAPVGWDLDIQVKEK